MSNFPNAPDPFEDPASDLSFSWFAVHVRSNFERLVSQHLAEKGYEFFLPTYHTQRRWSDRVKHLDVPLFPGYVFCRLDPANRVPVLTVPGVVQIVGQGRTPIAISEAEIGAIRKILTSNLPYSPWSSWTRGQQIVVEHGPLMGLQGVLLETRDPHRIVVSVTMLQRSVAVEVDAAWVRPVRNTALSQVTAQQQIFV
jgi:transcription antitermination factor NusG